MNITALIPARGGSKGIPHKNIHFVGGKPLICHTIEQAQASTAVRRVVVTTDDEEIAAVSKAAGAEVIARPAAISSDHASSESALIHALNELRHRDGKFPDAVVFLQCTCPLRRTGDIDAAIRTLFTTNADSLLSVSPNHRFLWQETEAGATPLNYDFRNRPRRQDMKSQYFENGSIYVFRPEAFLKAGNRLFGKIALFKMDEYAAVDIDSLLDVQLVEQLLAERASLESGTRNA